MVLCHGDFLNADHDYVHKNKHVKGFGTYGDIMIRDRKMYVVPTPFRLIDGANAHLTLGEHADYKAPDDFQCVGEMVRVESKRLVTQYTFDLQSNDIRINTEPNPSAGTEHRFKAWRLKSQPLTKVKLAVIQ